MNIEENTYYHLKIIKEQKSTFYTVPEHYFENLNNDILSRISEREEFPFLYAQSKSMPYHIPQIQVENINNITDYQCINDDFDNKKIGLFLVSKRRSYIAAACLVAIFLTCGSLFFSLRNNNKFSLANIDQKIKTASQTQLEKFIEIDNTETFNREKTVEYFDVNQIFKNVSYNEMKNFVDETSE